jgi:subtilase family serine protease
MSKSLRRFAVVAAAAAVAASPAMPANAASASLRPAPRVILDSAPAWTHTATITGPARGATQLHLTAVLPLRDAAAAERLALAVSTPGTVQYGHYLTAAQWRSRFAPTDATVRAVTGWLRAHGFAVTSVPANHRYIAFTGTVAAANAAFGVALTNYVADGRSATAPSAAVTVPAELAGSVAGISGLDSTARMTPARDARESQSPAPARPATVPHGATLPGPGPAFVNAPPCSAYFGQKVVPNVPEPFATPLTYAVCGYTPAQIRRGYGTSTSTELGLNGSGVTVAIVDAYASPTIFDDATRYAYRNDRSHPLRARQFSQLLAGDYRLIDECNAQGWYGEETLDVEAVHGTAPAAKILYVGAASCDDADVLAAVNAIVDGGLASIISNSYGNAGEPPLADIQAEHQTYLQAAGQGISVLFASGDAGDNIAATGIRQPDYPASDPFVTAVGGTALAVGSRGQYEFETGWGTKRSVLSNGAWTPFPGTPRGASGGGTSLIWNQPAYQRRVVPDSIADINDAGHPQRAVPDLAMVGDPNTGYLVGQTQEFPDGSIRYSEYRIGGTSLSCPLLAGIQATANQLAHRRLGFLNPRIYRLAGSLAFRDVASAGVTTGVVRNDYVNGVDATDGTVTSLRTLNDTDTTFTRPGYDDVTGVGTPRGVVYLYAVTAVPGFGGRRVG